MKILTDTLDKDVQFLRNERNEKKKQTSKNPNKEQKHEKSSSKYCVHWRRVFSGILYHSNYM